MSAAISTASYIHYREKSTPPPPSSPWEQRGRRPFTHFTMSGSKSAATNRRNRTLGRIAICLVLIVVIGMAMGVGGWVCEGDKCAAASSFLSQSRITEPGAFVGGGSVLGPLHSQTDPDSAAPDSHTQQDGDAAQMHEQVVDTLDGPEDTFQGEQAWEGAGASAEQGNEPELVDMGSVEPEHEHGESGEGVAVFDGGEGEGGGQEVEGGSAVIGTMDW